MHGGGGDSQRCKRRVVLGDLHGDVQPCSPHPDPTSDELTHTIFHTSFLDMIWKSKMSRSHLESKKKE